MTRVIKQTGKKMKFYQNKKIIITGGLGFIGSSLAQRLVDYGAKVVLIDSLIPVFGGNLFNIKDIESKVKVNISDVRDRYSINYLVKDQDLMFNLAGTLSHIDSMTDPFTDLEINCVSQLSILEACRQNNPGIKIVYAGTRNQYGKVKQLPVKEDHPLNPTDINGINCNAGEAYHILYHNIHGIKSTSLRMTNTYGPRHQMRHSRQGVFNFFLRQLIDGEKIRLFGTGQQIRDLNYIDDVIQALLLMGASDQVWGKTYNIGGTPISLAEFVTTAIKVYGKGEFEMVAFPKEREKIEIGDYVADYSRLSKEVSWQPEVDIKDGIDRTIKFYEKNKEHYW